MNANPIRKNVLIFTLIGAVIVYVMSLLYPNEVELIISMAAIVVGGGIGNLIKDLVSPVPSPATASQFIPLRFFKRVIGIKPHEPSPVPAVLPPQQSLMPNAIGLALIGTVLVLYLAWKYKDASQANLVFPVVNGLLAVLVSAAKDLVLPDPPEEKPEPLVPIEAGEAYLDERDAAAAS